MMAEAVNIVISDKDTMFNIFCGDLNMKQECAEIVSKLLTTEKKRIPEGHLYFLQTLDGDPKVFQKIILWKTWKHGLPI